MHGHLWIPNGSISTEAFVSHGHQYTYFGIFPSLLRVPIFAFTNSFDGRLTAPSILASWITTALFCSLLLWRLRTVLGAKATLGWIEAGSLWSAPGLDPRRFHLGVPGGVRRRLRRGLGLECRIGLCQPLRHPRGRGATEPGTPRRLRSLRSVHEPQSKHDGVRRHLCHRLRFDLVRHGTSRTGKTALGTAHGIGGIGAPGGRLRRRPGKVRPPLRGPPDGSARVQGIPPRTQRRPVLQPAQRAGHAACLCRPIDLPGSVDLPLCRALGPARFGGARRDGIHLQRVALHAAPVRGRRRGSRRSVSQRPVGFRSSPAVSPRSRWRSAPE